MRGIRGIGGKRSSARVSLALRRICTRCFMNALRQRGTNRRTARHSAADGRRRPPAHRGVPFQFFSGRIQRGHAGRAHAARGLWLTRAQHVVKWMRKLRAPTPHRTGRGRGVARADAAWPGRLLRSNVTKRAAQLNASKKRPPTTHSGT